MKALLGICVIGFIVIAVFTLSKKDQDITDLDEGATEEVQAEKSAPEPKVEKTKEEPPKVADAPPPEKKADGAGWVKSYKPSKFVAKKGDRFIIDVRGNPLKKNT